MSTSDSSFLAEIGNEIERTLLSIKAPDYQSDLKAVYPYTVTPEMVKNWPAAWFTITQCVLNEGKTAASRLERAIQVRLALITRQDVQRNVQDANYAIMRDVETALAKEMSAAQKNIRDKSGADLLWWQPPNWERIDSTWSSPYGIVIGSVKVVVRYDYGKP